MNAINKALPPVRFVGNGRKRALQGVKPLCTMQGGSDMQENHLLKRQSPLYPGMKRGGSLFLYPTPRGAGRVNHAGVIYRGMAALHVCAVPAALYVCEAMARGGGGAHGAYWCLLFVLIRQGLRGGSVLSYRQLILVSGCRPRVRYALTTGALSLPHESGCPLVITPRGVQCVSPFGSVWGCVCCYLRVTNREAPPVWDSRWKCGGVPSQ